MIKILVLNLGSSSIKYQLLDMDKENVLAKGLVEKIGTNESVVTYIKCSYKKTKIVKKISNHLQGIKIILKDLLKKNTGVIKSFKEINAVGHRIVQGGNYFDKSFLVNNLVKKNIKKCFDLAPLHNPPQYEGIIAIEKIMPNIPNVVSFDTVFHQTLPEYIYTYAIPYEWSKEYGIRKYGFHGLSHSYVAKRASIILKKDLSKLKIITCHLGNGASISAINKGESVDTSMGFTPLQGLVMGTRCGDIDPTIISYMMSKKGYNINQINSILNNKSGVKGISGISNDFRDIELAAKQNNKRAILALEKFYYSVRFYISAYYGILNGIDVLIFTGGLGENSPKMRKSVCKNFNNLGIKIDLNKNKSKGKEIIISPEKSKIKIIVIPTNEELTIARDVKKIILK